MAAGTRGRALWVALAAGCKVSNPLFIDSGGSDASSAGPGTMSTGEASTSTTTPEETTSLDPQTTTSDTTAGASDDTTAGEASSSSTGPIPELCGNGEMDEGEDCDDGNPVPGDACEPNCRFLFGPAVDIVEPSEISAIAAGDFDANGSTDLALGRAMPAGVRLFVNDGGGAFSESMPFVTASAPLGMAAGGIDGAPGDDLLLALESEIHVYVQGDGGAFTLSHEINSSSVESSLRLLEADGEAPLDIAFTQSDLVQASMYPGAGDGTFGTAKAVAIPAAEHLAVGDLGEGEAPDLVVTYSNGGVGYVQIRPDFDDVVKPEPIAVGKSAKGVAIVELVADHPGPEIVVADPAGERVWLLGRDAVDGPYAPLGEGTKVGGQPTELMVLALRGGDELDVVTLDAGNGEVAVLAVTAQGLAEAPLKFATLNKAPAGWAAGDFDGDQRLDLAVAAKTDGVMLLANLSAK